MDLTAALAYLCLVSALVTYTLGLAVFFRNPESSVHRLFLLATLAGSAWAADEFLIWQSALSGPGPVEFWLKAGAFWTFAIMLTVHFVLAFTGHPLGRRGNLRYLIAFLYVPAGAVSLAEIFTGSIYTVVREPGTGFVYTAMTGSPAYLAESAMFTLVMGLAVWVAFSAWMRQPAGKIRRQNLLVSIGIVLLVISGAVSAFLLPFAGIHLPNLVFIGIVCFSAIISYAMVRQGLFTLSAESAAENIIRTMPDGLIIADAGGFVIVANASAEALFSRGPGDLAGLPLDAILPRASADTIRDRIRSGGTLADHEAVLGPPGHRTLSIAASPIADPGGNLAGSILILRDVTRQKASARALRLAKEKLSLLTRLTRHDIANMMTALAGHLLLMEEKTTDPGIRQHVASCEAILRRIEGQLRFSREYEEIGEHEPVWQDLGGLVDQAKGDLVPARAEIAVTLPKVRIYADPLVVKVMYNLLENALRHGGGKLSRVGVTTREGPEGDLILVVSDDGTGIPSAEKELIFTHGYGKNTGLGLSLSREILALTGITITENGVAGEGARFELCIPPEAWERDTARA